MDRGPPRASDRGQSFAPAACTRSAPRSMPRATSSPSTTLSSTTRAPMCAPTPPASRTMTCGMLPGPYRVPAYRAIGHFRLTNKTPAATYRAPGRYETTFVRERLVDAIAHQARHRPHRGAPAQRRAAPTRCRIKRPLEALGEEIHFDTGDYHRAARQAARPRRLGQAQRRADAARRAKGETGRRRPRHVRREERARPGRRRAHLRSTPPARSRSSPAALRSARASRP